MRYKIGRSWLNTFSNYPDISIHTSKKFSLGIGLYTICRVARELGPERQYFCKPFPGPMLLAVEPEEIVRTKMAGMNYGISENGVTKYFPLFPGMKFFNSGSLVNFVYRRLKTFRREPPLFMPGGITPRAWTFFLCTILPLR